MSNEKQAAKPGPKDISYVPCFMFLPLIFSPCSLISLRVSLSVVHHIDENTFIGELHFVFSYAG